MNELTKENVAIGKMESYYMRSKRNVIYTSLEDIEDTDWFWCPSEINEFDQLWNEGKPITEIAQELRRSEIAVMLLSFDRVLKGKIEPRKEWRIW